MAMPYHIHEDRKCTRKNNYYPESGNPESIQLLGNNNKYAVSFVIGFPFFPSSHGMEELHNIPALVMN